MASEKLKAITQRIIDPAIMLTSIAAIIYLVGRSYHSGFLNYFAIDEQLFPYGLHDVLTWGYQAYVVSWRLLVNLICIVVAAFSVLIVMVIVTEKLKQKLNLGYSKEIIDPRRWPVVLNRVMNVITVLPLIAVLIPGSALMLMSASSTGKAQAQHIVKQWDKSRGKSNAAGFNQEMEFVISEEGKTIAVTGFIIDATEALVAIYTANAVERILIIPRQDIKRINIKWIGRPTN